MSILANFNKRKIQQALFRSAMVAIIAARKYANSQEGIRVLCLPGESGYDVRYFLSFDQVIEVVCLESESSVFEVLRSEFGNNPRVKLLNTSTSKFLFEDRSKFDLIYLDYFTNLSSMVRIDLELIFRHNHVAAIGRLIVNFYGARETPHDWVQNRLIYEDFCSRYKQPAVHLGNPELLRVAAFNALCWGLIRKYKHQTSPPSWWKYASDGGNMYTAVLSYWRSKHNRSDNLRRNEAKWFLTDFQFQTLSSKNFHQTSRLNTVEARESTTKHQIEDFFGKHQRTPSLRELVKANPLSPIKTTYTGYNKLVRELGLLPVKNRTTEDWARELKRVYARDGYLSWETNLKRYHIQQHIPLLKRLSVELGSPIKETSLEYHELVTRVVHLRVIAAFLDSQKAGKSKSYCDGYIYLKRLGLHHLSTLELLREVDKHQKWVNALRPDFQADFERLMARDLNSLRSLNNKLKHLFGIGRNMEKKL